ncbi:copper amine oxidase N-terminal domain-containing protein [Cohnella sp. GbtcB17]|uniref:copper amine oxidase N-terminal domain-containing protein n=1 Tax=Cohnella sp. GbtcB17 TaxID=2824762 RepID=UPI001C30ACB4|nr:copper amine oxidase N-terminal domain-containing protein [Cohnella sp. GbtcB17]
MKNAIKYMSIFIAGAIFATAGSAYGASAVQTIKASIRGDLKINVNGKPIDAQPITYNNTTYLPLRKAAEAVGGQVSINGSTISIQTQKQPSATSTPTPSPSSGPSAMPSPTEEVGVDPYANPYKDTPVNTVILSGQDVGP